MISMAADIKLPDQAVMWIAIILAVTGDTNILVTTVVLSVFPVKTWKGETV